MHNYEVEVVNDLNIINVDSKFRFIIQVNNYTKEDIVLSYIKRYDKGYYPDETIKSRHNFNYEFVEILVSTIDQNNNIKGTIKFKLDYKKLINTPIKINELGMIVALQSQKHAIDTVNKNLKGLSDFRKSFEDYESICQICAFGNDPYGNYKTMYVGLGKFIIPVTLTNEPTEDRYFTIWIKDAEINDIIEINLTQTDFQGIGNHGYIEIPIVNKQIYVGKRLDLIKEAYEEYLKDKYETKLDILTSSKDSDIEKLKNIIKEKESEIENLNVKITTTENSYKRKELLLNEKIENLETENKVLRSKLKELGITTQINLENRKIDAELKKTEVEIKKSETNKEIIETTKDINKIKKEKEEVSKEKEISKKQQEEKTESIKVEKEKLSLMKEFFKIAPTASIAIFSIYMFYKNNDSKNKKELLKIFNKLFKVTNTNNILNSDSILNNCKKLLIFSETDLHANDNSITNNNTIDTKINNVISGNSNIVDEAIDYVLENNSVVKTFNNVKNIIGSIFD